MTGGQGFGGRGGVGGVTPKRREQFPKGRVWDKEVKKK